MTQPEILVIVRALMRAVTTIQFLMRNNAGVVVAPRYRCLSWHVITKRASTGQQEESN